MNPAQRSPKIRVGDCFLAPDNGVDLYYQQQKDYVIHISPSSTLVCLLKKDHVATLYDLQRPIARILQQEFREVAGQVFNQLGCRFQEDHAFWQLQASQN